MGEFVKKQTFLRSASCFYNSRNWVVPGAQEQKSKDTQKKLQSIQKFLTMNKICKLLQLQEILASNLAKKRHCKCST